MEYQVQIRGQRRGVQKWNEVLGECVEDASYRNMLGEYLSGTDAEGVRALIVDALGSNVAETDPPGALVTSYSYEPFGRTEATGAALANPFQYSGRENDGTGLYYYRARYYHPMLQRFISENPIGFAGGEVNLSAYIWNAPLNYIDPPGLGGALILGGRGGVYVGVDLPRFRGHLGYAARCC